MVSKEGPWWKCHRASGPRPACKHRHAPETLDGRRVSWGATACQPLSSSQKSLPALSLGGRFIRHCESALDHDSAGRGGLADRLERLIGRAEAIAADPNIRRALLWRQSARFELTVEALLRVIQRAFVEDAVDEDFHG